ncbi:S1 RNA-binding domain-containing protein [Nodularia spumigena CS-584]|jgi:small subunit ribosomal protein S1|uniref:S1 RNA-binding domain-containing protein n=1 Tax=Nodularia spumigena UHCC 0060 TaxID=3110300 RepID=A0ABU5UQ11_NODSP|nr:S1 RNA-binding domain-containing protein [Nodularia spumigena]MDB9384788.1 S1 RNA-binding domain-containing protein [Nodularia spumigena CS-584]MEA5526231.1 S1 RNA-binding domain-containing protein [Nodularia spumigena UHCC 0143]MEA5559056.1 S1 RNA-binding domain-containing protein [Nodularia spumigena CH309]MEA5608339.1 S1 RNA-binding domain-containing protein [Nodularia spumigena UHCC 0060]MEA5612680.1 S1 RNA-binding domain-containing protein [Nodularia spumigena UHCC 0040]
MNSESKLSQPANSSFTMDDFAKALEVHDYQFQKGQVVRGKVFQLDPNGAYVDIGGKSSAFLPREEASLRAVTDLSEVLPLQEELEFLIIRDQDAEGQVTLSRKQLEIQQVWERLTEMNEGGQTVQVRVTGVNKGGVTVDILSLRGFIPRSHLAERDNLEALKGQSLTVAFLEINRNTNKLILSQRLATRSSSFSLLQLNQLVEGRVTGIKPFGIFVDLDGLSALLHIKQVSQKYIESLEKVFQIGQTIKAVIIDLDEGKGRVAISTRVLENFPGEMLENFDEVMASAEARANRATNKPAE